MSSFFAPLAEPVGALWSLMVLGVLWLLWHRQWRSALWLGLPTVVLFAIGSTPLTDRLVANEEGPWVANEKAEIGNRPGEVTTTTFTGQGKSSIVNRQSSIENGPPVSAFSLQPSAFPYDAVVALGGGERVSQHDLFGFALSDGGSRILTAIELVRSGKAKTLVLGGSWPMPGQPDAPSMSLVQDWVMAWGLAGGTVTNLGVCINTHDEAVAFGKLARSRGWSKVILVTSALHLRRGVALFKKQGVEVTPVAADFQALGVPPDPFSPFPREHRLFLMTLYLHEKIGWWVYRARGWVG